jgi:hypothetical protein
MVSWPNKVADSNTHRQPTGDQATLTSLSSGPVQHSQRHDCENGWWCAMAVAALNQVSEHTTGQTCCHTTALTLQRHTECDFSTGTVHTQQVHTCQRRPKARPHGDQAADWAPSDCAAFTSAKTNVNQQLRCAGATHPLALFVYQGLSTVH